MAYSGVATVSRYTVSGRRHFLVTVVETECAATSEYTITGLPELCTIVSFEATKTAGDGASITPIIGRATAPADGVQNHIRTYPAASLHIHDESPTRLRTALGIVYVRSTPASGSNNSIGSTWLFVEGHDVGVHEPRPVYNATPASRVEGRRGPLQAHSDGSLLVRVAGNASGASSVQVDDAAYTPATSSVTVVGGECDETSTDLVDEGDAGAFRISARRALYTSQDTLIAGEDQTNNVMKTEMQFTGTQCTADTQVKASAGFLHTITVMSTDAVPTAGSIIIFDNTAESGTQVFNLDIKATASLGAEGAQTFILDRIMTTGIYVGFTTVADVAVQVTWR